MSLTASAVETRKSQRPYRYGMILLCVGALINWLGLAENYVEPVRYVGVACIIAGALLICAAMCCWLQRPANNQRTREGRSAQVSSGESNVHVIEIGPDQAEVVQKPPDYESVAGTPPCYEDAVKLSPALLLPSCSTTAQVDYIPAVHQSSITTTRATPSTPPPPYTAPNTSLPS